MPRIVVAPEKCGGCDTCTLVCSVKNLKVNNKQKGAIRIDSKFPLPGKYEIRLCKQSDCANQPCLSICPVGAIARNSEGIVGVDKEKCILCKACETACPNGAIFDHRDLKHVIQCNLCNGDPECVKWCPTQAIRYEAGGASA